MKVTRNMVVCVYFPIFSSVLFKAASLSRRKRTEEEREKKENENEKKKKKSGFF